jgi:arginine-tRNA-protein transferase
MSSFGYLIGPSKSECGYCKNESTSQSFGIWAYRLTVDQYQLMLDKGWRRSGHYLYKPNLENTCCPTYTIRLDVLKFEASKGQLKVIKKMQKFLYNGGIVKLCERNQVSTEKDISTELINTDAVIPFIDKDAIIIDTPSEPYIRKQSISWPNLERKSGLETIFETVIGEKPSAKHKLHIVLEPAAFSIMTQIKN